MARFSWSALPSPLLRALTRDLDPEAEPDSGEIAKPAEDETTTLRKLFGERPREEFIRAAWARLRDIWLARDVHARRAVVDRLVDAGLGDPTLLDDTTDPADAEMAYLRSCRNTPALRQAVLEVLVDTGMGVVPSAAVRRRVRGGKQPAERPVAPSGGILRDRVATSWANFERRLTGELAALTPGDSLTLAFDPEARTQSTEEGSFYVRLQQREYELVASAASNDVLPPDHRLDRDAMHRLIEQGWEVPDPDGDGHFHVAFAAEERRLAAALAVEALREVYGAPHPAFLRYQGRAVDGTAIELPRLGLRHVGDQADWEEPGEETAPAPAAKAGAKPAEAPPAEGHAELEERVRRVVAAVTDLDEETLTPDEKSGIPVRAGTAMVFVRVRGELPIVEVYSPVLLDVSRTSQLLDKLNSINASAPFVKTFVTEDVVYAAIQLSGSDFDPGHLEGALRFMTKFAPDVDEKLQGDFGGRPFFGEALPGRPGTPTGYYL